MDIGMLTKLLLDNIAPAFAVVLVLLVVLLVIVVNQASSISRLKKRYRRLMTGVESGNLERLLLGHIDEVRRVSEENTALALDVRRISDELTRAVTRVGVVRYRAFPEIGGDLSYAVALLDKNNDGVILSSVFAREGSQPYAKPIKGGTSSYTLTQEEQQALQSAMHGSGAR